ncbi:hypothetical protein BTA51_20050 [Hahella sp. CCB-MM4]|uniref:hypothetical protein n=1 Tax=Hahella sp. (strain CCB-MM4) TaxID=1926491 RepID=UPI000B9C69D7|nr:hypothetical protein [Hahella sp. CCB-MM4]OZG71577.1 hypothetical protein BTA51_20050 [Hahella sp. CCB-MM4]
MERISITLSIIIVMIMSINVSAAKLSIGNQSGEPFLYDQGKDYVTISLKDLNLPSINERGSKLFEFLKELFLDRKKYGVAYIQVTPEFGEKQKTVIFTYERDDDERYKFRYVGANNGVTYLISSPFIYGGPVSIDVVLKEWEDEVASSAVKTILSATESSPLAVEYQNILSNVTLLLDLVEALFPPDSTEEALSLKLNPADIKKKDIQISGEGADFFKITLTTIGSFFMDFDTENGLRRAHIENIDAWKQVLNNADKNLSSDGKEPLVAVVQSFSDYVSTLPINRNDKAILTACAINDWADNAVNGNTSFEDEKVQFTAHDYSKLPTSNLELVRNSRCDFSGVNCNSSNCLAMSDFINKSSRSSARRIASKLYLDGELTITLSDSEIVLTPDEYISSFRIIRPAFFQIEPTGPNSWSYYFQKGSLDVRINGDRYMPYDIRIDLVKETVSEASRYIVSGIEIDTSSLVAGAN